jgi:hypothetical protein
MVTALAFAYNWRKSGSIRMANSTEVSTACLDVTLQVNKAWVKRGAAAYKEAGLSTSEDETMLLCSDIITVDDELRAKPQFDITTYVMEHGIAHTLRYCKNHGASIRAFRSAEVLRLMQPGLPVSFLFIFEAVMAAHTL